jgi:hypothetical protein
MIKVQNEDEIKEFAERARKIAVETSIPGCASDVFWGIAEALQLEGREYVFMATLGYAGGCGESTIGTCGAILGAAAAITLASSLTFEKCMKMKENPEKYMVPFYSKKMPKKRYEDFNRILDVMEKVKEKYGGVTCADIQFEGYGQALDLRDPRIREKWHKDVAKYCQELEGDIAAWSVEAILHPSKWDKRLREWEFPRSVIKRDRGRVYEEEEKKFKFHLRFIPGKGIQRID